MFDRISRSWELVKASASVLAGDKELLLFPLISTGALLIVIASFAVPVIGLGMFGLTLGDYLRAADPKPMPPRDAAFGKAKACILLFLYGSPSQLELADMKPDAPVEVRGELKPIRSTLPGCDVVELMPYSSRVMDKVTVVRSCTHKPPIHGVAFATTAIPDIDVPMELAPPAGRPWPFIGSVVSYL